MDIAWCFISAANLMQFSFQRKRRRNIGTAARKKETLYMFFSQNAVGSICKKIHQWKWKKSRNLLLQDHFIGQDLFVSFDRTQRKEFSSLSCTDAKKLQNSKLISLLSHHILPGFKVLFPNIWLIWLLRYLWKCLSQRLPANNRAKQTAVFYLSVSTPCGLYLPPRDDHLASNPCYCSVGLV